MSTSPEILSLEKHFHDGHWMSSREYSFNEYFKLWQVREDKWIDRLGDGWVITRTLGAGAGGGASLWEWRGDPERAPKLKKVVIKLVYDGYEVYPDTYTGLRGEAAFLDLLTKVPTKHLIHIYGPPKKDDHGHVMYFLEECPGGALSTVLEQHGDEAWDDETKRCPVSESDMWSIFHCLARAVTAMDRGTEYLEKERWDRDEIGHYDMITSNILIGYNDEIHKRCPIFKVGDFGDAMEIRRLELQTDETGIQDKHSRGAVGGRPPEQRDINVQHLRHGTCSNIYMVGLIMTAIIASRKYACVYDDDGRVMDYNENLRKGKTLGISLYDDEDFRKAYSKSLRALIMECLIKEQLLRPSAAELQNRTGEMFKSVANIVGEYFSSGFGSDNVLLGNFNPPREWMGPDDAVDADDSGGDDGGGISEPNKISSNVEDERKPLYVHDFRRWLFNILGTPELLSDSDLGSNVSGSDYTATLEPARKRRRDEADLEPWRKRRRNEANLEPRRKRLRGNDFFI